MVDSKTTCLFFCIICFILFCGSAKATDKTGSPPKSGLAAQMPDSLAKASALHQQGDSLLGIMGYREAEAILNRAYAMAQRLNEIKLMCKIANNLAECYSMTGRHEKAEDIYLKAYHLLGTIHDTNAMAIILINLGDEYAKTGRPGLAAETELKAIRLKETSLDYRKLAFYYQKLGELFIDRDNAKWEYYAMKALALSRTKEYTTLRATVAIYNDLGAIWRIKDNFVKAEAYYDTMYRISEEAGYKKGILTATSERALLCFDMGRFQAAVPLASKAYEMALEADDDYHIVYGATLKARILIKLNQPAKAVDLLTGAVARAHNARLPDEEMAACKYLSEAYRSTGQWEAAFLSQDRYITMKDSIDGLEVRKTLNALQLRFETEKKQQLIDRLNEKNLAHEKRSFLLIGLLIASLLALFSLAIIVRLRNRTIKQNQVLSQKEQDIHRLEHARLSLDLDYKARALTTATVHLINKNEVLSDLKNKLSNAESNLPELSQAIRQIDQNINLDNDWQNFSQHFEGVHPEFFKRLREKYPALTPNEDRLCAYLLLNLNTKEISQMLNVTSAAVDKSRNRLRKKLAVTPDINLNEFLLQV